MFGIKIKKNIGQIILHIAFILISAIYVIPFVLIISVSLTEESAIMKYGYHLIPKVFSLEAYKLVFADMTQLLQSYMVTTVFTLAYVALSILIMAVAAYPLARKTFKYRRFFTMFVLITMLFSAGMVPNYLLIVKYLGLKNNILVYILPGLVSAYYLLIIRTNYANLPVELIEAAKLDGASELTICFRIMIPLSKPVLASTGFLLLVSKWNDWNTTLLYITDTKLYSLQYLLQRILRETAYLQQMAAEGMYVMEDLSNFPSESYRYAMAVVAAGPVLVIFPLFQKYFSKGITLGGVKG